MTVPVENLIECLREELKQYGEMLALLEAQQGLIVRHNSGELLDNVTSIHAQGTAIQAARCEREQHQRHVSRHLGLPDDTGLHHLIARLPASYQPLAEALTQENNDLLRRVQHCARQNHLLLRRALELMQQFISALAPAGGTPVYSEAGQVLSPARPPHSLYDAIGRSCSDSLAH
jgi:flagellar biosynthesis/type III secretory pathway chaperone